ncbi:PREDICTED: uncharacterized protein LOC106125207 [Papilio xuthus]|uniref:Uncharacterized protein LOC106125207 n=1 Tax=Papilio xuthus TaxID=66420 RepID=A0AAJ6ZRB7_PAPXU|nr:PREDICTED: uncharacterized protein LOC106125207 [Papilio xuthus]
MCDCAEEQQRQAEKRAEQSGSRARSGARGANVPAEGAACYTEERSGCRFFTCGLWAGGAAGAGGWLPYAGSALLLALMAYMLRNVRKHVDKFPKLPKMGNLFGTSKTVASGAKKSFQCDYSK